MSADHFPPSDLAALRLTEMTANSSLAVPSPKIRLAVIVSHPIQYHVPLYRRLARRSDLELKVFFTWHGGTSEQMDRGFKKQFAWDIPLTNGYKSEVVPNTSRNPGTHHFRGLCNPSLVHRVLAWKPDAVHLTGYAYVSHLASMRAFHQVRVPLFFRGDSHLLNQRRDWKWLVKRSLLRAVYRWPAAFLYVGEANRNYYDTLGVPRSKLFYCPHSIDVARFAEPHDQLETEAKLWRRELRFSDDMHLLLFAGKFERKKRPVELMRAVAKIPDPQLMLLMVGDGEFGPEMRRLADAQPHRFRVIPFQNQSRMPLVYRLGDVFTLPSAYEETWGLAVNEALACGRPVLVSDKVGCSADVVQSKVNGATFRADDWSDFQNSLAEVFALAALPAADIQRSIRRFDITATEETLVAALKRVIVHK